MRVRGRVKGMMMKFFQPLVDSVGFEGRGWERRCTGTGGSGSIWCSIARFWASDLPAVRDVGDDEKEEGTI